MIIPEGGDLTLKGLCRKAHLRRRAEAILDVPTTLRQRSEARGRSRTRHRSRRREDERSEHRRRATSARSPSRRSERGERRHSPASTNRTSAVSPAHDDEPGEISDPERLFGPPPRSPDSQKRIDEFGRLRYANATGPVFTGPKGVRGYYHPPRCGCTICRRCQNCAAPYDPDGHQCLACRRYICAACYTVLPLGATPGDTHAFVFCKGCHGSAGRGPSSSSTVKSEAVKPEQCGMIVPEEEWALLTVDAGCALLDSGCTSTLLGDEVLPRFAEELHRASGGCLAIRDWPDVNPISFHGLGGVKTSNRGVLIPVAWGPYAMWLEVHLVEGNIPLLLSSTTMKRLQAVHDHVNDRLYVGKAKEWFDLQVTGKHHMFYLFDFRRLKEWHLPPEETSTTKARDLQARQTASSSTPSLAVTHETEFAVPKPLTTSDTKARADRAQVLAKAKRFVDPEDGEVLTSSKLWQKYLPYFSGQEISEYWLTECLLEEEYADLLSSPETVVDDHKAKPVTPVVPEGTERPESPPCAEPHHEGEPATKPPTSRGPVVAMRQLVLSRKNDHSEEVQPEHWDLVRVVAASVGLKGTDFETVAISFQPRYFRLLSAANVRKYKSPPYRATIAVDDYGRASLLELWNRYSSESKSIPMVNGAKPAVTVTIWSHSDNSVYPSQARAKPSVKDAPRVSNFLAADPALGDVVRAHQDFGGEEGNASGAGAHGAVASVARGQPSRLLLGVQAMLGTLDRVQSHYRRGGLLSRSFLPGCARRSCPTCSGNDMRRGSDATIEAAEVSNTAVSVARSADGVSDARRSAVSLPDDQNAANIARGTAKVQEASAHTASSDARLDGRVKPNVQGDTTDPGGPEYAEDPRGKHSSSSADGDGDRDHCEVSALGASTRSPPSPRQDSGTSLGVRRSNERLGETPTAASADMRRGVRVRDERGLSQGQVRSGQCRLKPFIVAAGLLCAVALVTLEVPPGNSYFYEHDLYKDLSLETEKKEEESEEAFFAERRGVSGAQVRDLVEWLGPQAWKLQEGLSVFMVELFAGRGQLRRRGEAMGLLIISLGFYHGQDLGHPRVPERLELLFLLVEPDHAFVAWPCGPYSQWQRVNRAKSPEAAFAVEMKQRLGKKLLDLFFICWYLQVPVGRHCTGENPQQSEALYDPRFEALDAWWALLRQCATGLRHPGYPDLFFEKPTWFVSSTAGIMQLNLGCPGGHDHTPLEGNWQGIPLTQYAENYNATLSNKILKALLSPDDQVYDGYVVEQAFPGLEGPVMQEEGLTPAPSDPDDSSSALAVEPYLATLLSTLTDGVYTPQKFTELELDDLQLHTGLKVREVRVASRPRQGPAGEYLRTAATTSLPQSRLRRASYCFREEAWQ